jgi:hypothetical protein
MYYSYHGIKEIDTAGDCNTQEREEKRYKALVR